MAREEGGRPTTSIRNGALIKVKGHHRDTIFYYLELSITFIKIK